VGRRARRIVRLKDGRIESIIDNPQSKARTELPEEIAGKAKGEQ
jgi:hypothetical protein